MTHYDNQNFSFKNIRTITSLYAKAFENKNFTLIEYSISTWIWEYEKIDFAKQFSVFIFIEFFGKFGFP